MNLPEIYAQQCTGKLTHLNMVFLVTIDLKGTLDEIGTFIADLKVAYGGTAYLCVNGYAGDFDVTVYTQETNEQRDTRVEAMRVYEEARALEAARVASEKATRAYEKRLAEYNKLKEELGL